MSASASAPTQAPVVRTGTGKRRALLWPLLVVVLVGISILATAALTHTSQEKEYDLDSAYETGSRALAQILRDRGVDVRQIDTPDQLEETDADTTVVVVLSEILGPDELDRLAALPSDLVLIAPDLPAVSALAPFAEVAGRLPDEGPVSPRCQDSDAEAAGDITGGGIVYRRTDPQATLCYPQGEDYLDEAGFLLRGQDRGRTVTVLGQAAAVRNEYLGSEGNAALVLRVMGEHERLLWFRPDPLAMSDNSAVTTSDLLPDWVRWVPLQLLVAIVVTIVWRARRLGPLVTEPLPVIVRAAETQEGRARLYRQVRARRRAAATLRTATARRVVALLDLPVRAGPDEVSAAVAALTGWSVNDVRWTLFGPEPTDDAQILRLANDLDDVERAASRGRSSTGSPSLTDGSGSTDPTTARKAENR
jgi:hypothetical protein